MTRGLHKQKKRLQTGNKLLIVRQTRHDTQLREEVDWLVIPTVQVTTRWARHEHRLRRLTHSHLIAGSVVLFVADFPILLSQMKFRRGILGKVDVVDAVRLLVVVGHHHLAQQFGFDSILQRRNNRN